MYIMPEIYVLWDADDVLFKQQEESKAIPRPGIEKTVEEFYKRNYKNIITTFRSDVQDVEDLLSDNPLLPHSLKILQYFDTNGFGRFNLLSSAAKIYYFRNKEISEELYKKNYSSVAMQYKIDANEFAKKSIIFADMERDIPEDIPIVTCLFTDKDIIKPIETDATICIDIVDMLLEQGKDNVTKGFEEIYKKTDSVNKERIELKFEYFKRPELEIPVIKIIDHELNNRREEQKKEALERSIKRFEEKLKECPEDEEIKEVLSSLKKDMKELLN